MDESTTDYEPPRIEEIGSVHELTLTGPVPKFAGLNDGFSFQGQVIGNVS